MSSSVFSPAKRALEDFVAGRLPADRLVTAVAGRFYGAAGPGERAALRPVLELVERSAPGVVSLERSDAGAGFDVRLVDRVFPVESLAALRGAAAAALAASWADPVHAAPPVSVTDPAPASSAAIGWVGRLLGTVRRLFSASS